TITITFPYVFYVLFTLVFSLVFFFFFTQKAAYDLAPCLDFSRVLFGSGVGGGDAAPGERMPQLPHAVPLQQNAVAHHQAHGLDRREDVQPYAGHHEAHGEAGNTGRHRAEKRRQEKKSENHAIHRSHSPNGVTSTWMEEAIS